MATTATAPRETPITTETIPVRLAKTVEVELPVVHRTSNGQFVVVSNSFAKVRESAHPYFVVHAASGLRSPVPPSVGRHTLQTAKQLAGFLELAGFFDSKTGKPIASADVIRTAVSEWRP